MCVSKDQWKPTLALVWNGTDFQVDGGSETEESDSEAPLTSAEQVQAIFCARSENLPPLPVDAKHALANSNAVHKHTEAVPPGARTQAQTLALSLPRKAGTVAEWAAQQFRHGRREPTLKSALCWALNPRKTAAWVCRKSGGNPSRTLTAKGLALHLRMHPFTRAEVERARDLLPEHAHRHRQQLYGIQVSDLVGVTGRRSAGELDAAMMMVLFQRGPLAR